MLRRLLERKIGALGVLTVLASVVPLVTTFQFVEWIQPSKVVIVAFAPFVINGILGLAIMYLSASTFSDGSKMSGTAVHED